MQGQRTYHREDRQGLQSCAGSDEERLAGYSSTLSISNTVGAVATYCRAISEEVTSMNQAGIHMAPEVWPLGDSAGW